MTPYGELRVSISHKDFKGSMTVTVPVGTSAEVYIPNDQEAQIFNQGTYTLEF